MAALRATSDSRPELTLSGPAGARRAAFIARTQADAAADEYALRPSGDTPQRGHSTGVLDAVVDEAVTVTFPGGENFSLGLGAYGCEGDARRVLPSDPVVNGHRAQWERQGAAGAVTEWYVHGPLGVEQGFVLEAHPDCTGNGVELRVDTAGTLSPVERQDGPGVLLRDARGRALARYGDLYVFDATGRELPAALDVDGLSIRIRFDAEGARFPVSIDPLVAVEQAKLLPSDPGSSPFLGGSVAVQGDTVVVAGPPAIVFERSGGAWVETAALTSSDPSGGPTFVALDGDTLVGGLGVASVFERVAGVWVEQTTLLPDDVQNVPTFGWSVDMSGDTIVIGDWSDDESGQGAGAAYVFVRDNGVWTQQAKLMASDGDGWNGVSRSENFGWSVAIDGDIIVVGSPEWKLDNSSAWWGATYVFTRQGTVWTEDAKLLASGTRVGNRVALSGETLLMTAGSMAYAFHREDGVWLEQGQFYPENAPDYLAIEGNLAVISTAAKHAWPGDANPPESGAGYLYQRIGSVWTEGQKFVPAEGLFQTYARTLGPPVALSGDTIVVSATANDFMGTPATAFVFVIRLSDGSPCTEGEECGSGFCTDGVCCDAACDAGPCDACSTLAGALSDGACSALTGPSCDDENACTQVDACETGVCVGSAPKACPAADACHDSCIPATGQCAEVPKPDGSPCDDGSLCTPVDVCLAGMCIGAGAPCDAPDPCHDAGTCDPATGACAWLAQPDGSPCDDGNPCTSDDACQSGVCVGAGAAECAPMDECHESGACDPATGACDSPPKPEGARCSTGTCQDGQCMPAAAPRDYVVGGGCGCGTTRGGGGSAMAWVLVLAAAGRRVWRSAHRRLGPSAATLARS